jgi:hypothetical protein
VNNIANSALYAHAFEALHGIEGCANAGQHNGWSTPNNLGVSRDDQFRANFGQGAHNAAEITGPIIDDNNSHRNLNMCIQESGECANKGTKEQTETKEQRNNDSCSLVLLPSCSRTQY